jgi:GxxExxY protein
MGRDCVIGFPFYKYFVPKGTIDFFYEDKIMVELKALIQLEDVHLAQGKNYLEAYNLEVGLLINFGAKSLEFKRLYNRLNQDGQD